MELVRFIGVIAVVLLFTKWFQPIQPTKDKVVKWLIDKIVKVSIRFPWFLELTQVVKLLTCGKCLSFWVILVLTHDIFVAATAAIVAQVVNNLMEFSNDNK